jgi:hypothetical protein
MRSELLINRFTQTSQKLKQSPRFEYNISRSMGTTFAVVKDGVFMDPFYRFDSESGHKGKGRKQHLGMDVTGPKSGDGGIKDPRRGLPVYAAVNTSIAIDSLNAVKAYNKKESKSFEGLGIEGSGNADMMEAKVALQPWTPKDDDSYGGIVGLSCVYSYTNNSGGTSEFTFYIEFLHLITDKYLPKDSTGTIASADQWSDTGRGIGFGPDLKDGAVLKPSFFTGPGFPIIGYLGATQAPHVHVQIGYFNKKTYEKMVNVRIDPTVAIY